MRIIKSILTFFKKYVPLFAAVNFILGIVSAVLYVSFLNSKAFADLFNENVSPVFRMLFAKLTYVFPISVAEALIITSPVLIFLILRAIFRYMDSREHGFCRSLLSMVSVLALLFCVFTVNFAAGYRGSTLDEKLELETGAVSVEELKDTLSYVTDKLNTLADSVHFNRRGESVRSCTHGETVNKAYRSYERLTETYDFIHNFKAPVKRLAASELMTYTHISGIYTFFTGEANLNTNYPEFVNVFTVAHEMAHQRGIARENEANFMAYLVCIGSDDTYMQYSGYLNMFEYLISALSGESSDAAKEYYSALDGRIYRELVLYSEFFDKYRDSAASDVVGSVNDAYLQSQGTPGTKSYGMVVDLAVAYHKNVK